MPVLLAVLGGYAVICLAVFLFQGRMVYYPDREILATPAETGLDYEDAFFEASDGVRLHGWYVPAPEPRGVLLFAHGNAGNISGRVPLLRIFHDIGLSTFMFDYRGYGRSEGSPSEKGTSRDIQAALAQAARLAGVEPGEVIVHGRSIGGAIAVRLAEETEVRGLIVDSSFTSAVDLGARVYWWLPVRLLARYRYESLRRLESVTCPKLFIHSVEDEVVPLAMGRKLYEAAPDPKTFLEIRGGHGDSFLVSEPAYRAGIASFVEALPPG